MVTPRETSLLLKGKLFLSTNLTIPMSYNKCPGAVNLGAGFSLIHVLLIHSCDA
jgi:hypothetical protein